MALKVGDLFELPENVIRVVGKRGKIRNPDETKVLARYEVVKIGDEFKGRILVTYGNNRKRNIQ